MTEYSDIRTMHSELNDIDRRLLDQETAIRANKSSISVGGLKITGGNLRLQSGGDLVIGGGGSLRLDENSRLFIGSGPIVPFKAEFRTRTETVSQDYGNLALIETPIPSTAYASAVIAQYSVTATATIPGHRQESYLQALYRSTMGPGDSEVSGGRAGGYTVTYSGDVLTMYASGMFLYYHPGGSSGPGKTQHFLYAATSPSETTPGTATYTGTLNLTTLWFI